ncbi:MAG: hypothetical protein P9X24_19415 [Candidatus Hatepunaea meridiana]|nr:hypothetical protein [Candidatus Hatepunaea meridiana]
MTKKNLEEPVLTNSARKSLDMKWQNRLKVILQDLSTWSQLKYTYAISIEGERLSDPIGPDADRIDNDDYRTLDFFRLSGIINEFMINIETPGPSQVTVELENEILYIASCEKLYLIAAFYRGIPSGYMSMKLCKRIRSLRSLLRKKYVHKSSRY